MRQMSDLVGRVLKTLLYAQSGSIAVVYAYFISLLPRIRLWRYIHIGPTIIYNII